MKPITLTTPDDKILSVSPIHLIAWGDKTHAGGQRGGFVAMAGTTGPKDVLENRREIDALFEAATASAPTNAFALTVSAGALIRAQEDAQG